MKPAVLEDLLNKLIENSFLRTLVLIKLNFTDKTMALLCKFIQINIYIKSIDVSWN